MYYLILIAVCFALSVLSNILINIDINTSYYFIFISLLGLSYSAICPLLISLGLEAVEDVKKEYIISSILLSSGSIGIMIIPYLMGKNIIGNKYLSGIALIICFVLISIRENIKNNLNKKEKWKVDYNTRNDGTYRNR